MSWDRYEYEEYSECAYKRFDCGSYKDLSPVFMKDNVAGNWIRSWEYSG